MRAEAATPNRLAHDRRALLLLAALALIAALALASVASAASPHQRGAGRIGSALEVSGPDAPAATASVIGGKNTSIERYPSLAFIEGLVATAGYACTGTVVAPKVILTAGHCVEDLESSSITQPEQIAVATGISNLQHIPVAKISRVEEVLAYPGFNPSKLQGDAGLLILKTPVTAPPVALAGPEDAELYEAGTELTIAGWGIDDRGSGHAPNQLQAAKVPIAETKRCKSGTERFYLFFDPHHQLCTLDAPKLHITTCHGDSGGPAFAARPDGTMVEVGITSLGDGTCNPSSPAVFTRVDDVGTWVQSWIDAVEAGGPKPAVKIPKAHLPALTLERAEDLSAYALGEAFKATFVRGQEKTIHCDRMDKSRLKCGVTWFKGTNDYFGTVTIFYAIRHNVVLPGLHYSVHWVDDHCYFHSDHRQTCRVHTKRK